MPIRVPRPQCQSLSEYGPLAGDRMLWLGTLAVLVLAAPLCAARPPLPDVRKSPQAGGSGSSPGTSTTFTMKRRQKLSAEELRKQLLFAEEVALGPPAAAALVSAADALRKSGLPYPGPALLRQRLDLIGLPMRLGLDTQLGKEAAEALQVLSRALRVHLEAAAKAGDGVRPKPEKLRELLDNDKKHDWGKTEAIPCLMQMLQAENEPIRKLLVERLGQIKGKEASQALALRAMTDLEPEIRERAVLALKSRPHDEYVPVLQSGLRYPWKPVADHAAEAIVALGLKECVPDIVKMLDERDLTIPFTIKKGRRNIPVILQVVRVNHLGNCILCHAPSADRTDLVRGAVPTPGQALPGPATTPAYYERGGAFVRADVTYLRQDFSVVQPVDAPNKWPSHQRYDYLVRLRPLTPKQAAFLTERAKEQKTTDQKEAMLFVLRELTGKDRGTTSKEWLAEVPEEKRPKLTTAERPTQPTREMPTLELSGPRAGITQEAKEARTSREMKTEELARAIPRMKEADKEKARADLAKRLAWLSGTDLSEKLQDDLVEVRIAAAGLCADKKDKAHIPGLIDLLGDREDEVVQAARQSLRRLAGQDFGPKANDSKASRAKAMKEWTSWWKKQLDGKGPGLEIARKPDTETGSKEIDALIGRLAKTSDAGEQKKVLASLVQMGKKASSAGSAVAGLLANKDRSVRLDACRTLIRIGAPEVKKAIAVLIDALRAAKTEDLEDEEQTKEREKVRALLVELGEPAVKPLVEVLQNAFARGGADTAMGVLNGAARQEVLKVLLGIGPAANREDVIAALKTIERKDPFAGIRKLARQVRVKLQQKD